MRVMQKISSALPPAASRAGKTQRGRTGPARDKKALGSFLLSLLNGLSYGLLLFLLSAGLT